MTKRVFRSQLAPTYARRGGSEQSCGHIPEPHVTYDKLAAGYRARIRCRCGKLDHVSRRLRERFDDAHQDAQAMVAMVSMVSKKPLPPARNRDYADAPRTQKAPTPDSGRGLKGMPTDRAATERKACHLTKGS